VPLVLTRVDLVEHERGQFPHAAYPSDTETPAKVKAVLKKASLAAADVAPIVAPLDVARQKAASFMP
jgi:hypothetical protein